MTEPYRLIIPPRVAVEIQQIHDRIAKDSPQNAQSMTVRIMDALELLQSFPHRAEVVSQPRGLKHPVRSVVVRPYIIYFRAIDDEKIVRILRVRHGARRQLQRFE